MPRPAPKRRVSQRLAAVLVAGAGLVALAGCDVVESADVSRGRELFRAQCQQCHVLAELGGGTPVGPNLDSAFADARASGMDSDTIEGVVQSQIANPREIDPSLEQSDPGLYNRTYMPAELVSGQDAEDVAAYVASVAGVPGIKPPEVPGGLGGEIFAREGCNGCHTLAFGEATGTTGPNLDETVPGMSPAELEEAIIDPNAEIAQDFDEGVMPTTYGELPANELMALIDYLLENAGK